MSQAEEQLARKRAEIILKVRGGRITVTKGAEQLCVSRKTYYQWETRALKGMMVSLANRPTGRPGPQTDPEMEALKRENQALKQKLVLTEQRLSLREKLQPPLFDADSQKKQK